MSEHALDVGLADFQQHVLEESKHRPVVVDFWAPWCGPCKSLKPILEKLAVEYGGKFLLAKINSDDNQELATRYGVRGIPSVKAFINGEPVDEFSGALPEGEVRAFLDRLIPSPADELRQQAADCPHGGGVVGCAEIAGRSLEARSRPSRRAARRGGNHARPERSRRSRTPDRQRAGRRRPARARLEGAFAVHGCRGRGRRRGCSARVAANENDLEARLTLANLLVAAGQYEAGMDQLLEIVRRDRAFEDDIGRKTLLSVFNLLGGGELVSRYRRLLASALN